MSLYDLDALQRTRARLHSAESEMRFLVSDLGEEYFFKHLSSVFEDYIQCLKHRESFYSKRTLASGDVVAAIRQHLMLKTETGEEEGQRDA